MEMDRSQLTNFKTVFKSEYGEDNQGRFWKRNADGTGPWTLDEKDDRPPLPSHSENDLFDVNVCVHRQVEGAPDHWCISVGPENGYCDIIQVRGDPFPGMARTDSPNPVDIFASMSLLGSHYLGQVSPNDTPKIKAIADTVPPPKAEKYSADSPNCQNWTHSVVCKLELAGLVARGKADELKTGVGLHWKDWGI